MIVLADETVPVILRPRYLKSAISDMTPSLPCRRWHRPSHHPVSAVRAVIDGAYEITAIGATETAGGAGALALALAAGYAGIAFLMEVARPQAVPPTFRRSEAKRAEQESPAEQPASRRTRCQGFVGRATASVGEIRASPSSPVFPLMPFSRR